MRKVYDLAVKTREYQNKNGENKANWLNIGAVMEKDGKQFIMIERWFNPASLPATEGRSTALVSMFEPREEQQPKKTSYGSGKTIDDMTDDVPF
jgi:hypothetical protein